MIQSTEQKLSILLNAKLELSDISCVTFSRVGRYPLFSANTAYALLFRSCALHFGGSNGGRQPNLPYSAPHDRLGYSSSIRRRLRRRQGLAAKKVERVCGKLFFGRRTVAFAPRPIHMFRWPCHPPVLTAMPFQFAPRSTDARRGRFRPNSPAGRSAGRR